LRQGDLTAIPQSLVDVASARRGYYKLLITSTGKTPFSMQDETPPSVALSEATGTNSSSAASPLEDRTDPFKLPEYESAFFRFVQTAVNSLIRAKNPVLSKFNTEPSSEIHTSRNTT